MTEPQSAQGSTKDYCSNSPGDNETGASPHFMITHVHGGALVYVSQCNWCKWIDFEDLDQQVRMIAWKKTMPSPLSALLTEDEVQLVTLPDNLQVGDEVRLEATGSFKPRNLEVTVMTDNSTMPMPEFTLKGKDFLAPALVMEYRKACLRHGLYSQAEQVYLAFREMIAWQANHPKLLRLPDHDHTSAQEPTALPVEGLRALYDTYQAWRKFDGSSLSLHVSQVEKHEKAIRLFLGEAD